MSMLLLLLFPRQALYKPALYWMELTGSWTTVRMSSHLHCAAARAVELGFQAPLVVSGILPCQSTTRCFFLFKMTQSVFNAAGHAYSARWRHCSLMADPQQWRVCFGATGPDFDWERRVGDKTSPVSMHWRAWINPVHTPRTDTNSIL